MATAAMSAAPVLRFRLPEPDPEEWTVSERVAIRLVDRVMRLRGEKAFATGLHRFVRRHAKLGSRRASRVIHYVLTERGYYDALSARAAERYPELTRTR